MLVRGLAPDVAGLAASGPQVTLELAQTALRPLLLGLVLALVLAALIRESYPKPAA